MISSYPWYFDDWFNSETRLSMTAEQRGVYRDLLDFCWKEGSIPTDENVLRRMAAVDGRTWARCWPRVSKCFFKEGERYLNGKVNVKRPSVTASKLSRSDSATKAANSRWFNKSAMRDASQSQCVGNAVLCGTPSPSPSLVSANADTVKDTSVFTWNTDETFTPLMELFRASGKPVIDEDFIDAYWAWKVLDFEQKKTRIDRLKANLDNQVYSDPNFIPAPRKFIEREWKRQLHPASRGGAGSAVDAMKAVLRRQHAHRPE